MKAHRGRYVGPFARLRGKTAILLRPHQRKRKEARNYDVWLAQFDERGLMHNGQRLDAGWHEFPVRHWKEQTQ